MEQRHSIKASLLARVATYGEYAAIAEKVENAQPSMARSRTATLAILWPYIAATLLAVVEKLPSLNNYISTVDEASYLVQARLVDTWETFIFAFQYRTETKFQLGLVPYILGHKLDEANAMLIVRLFGLAALIVSACLIVRISKQLFNSVIPAFLCLIPYLLFLNITLPVIAPLLEIFQLPFLLAALSLFIGYLQRSNTTSSNIERCQNSHKVRSLYWCGLTLGLATLIKPTAPVVAVAMALWLALPVLPKLLRRQLSWKQLVNSLAHPALALILGTATPIVLFVLPYFFRPAAMQELIYNTFQLPLDYTSGIDRTYASRIAELISMLPMGIGLFITLLPLAYLCGKMWQRVRNKRGSVNKLEGVAATWGQDEYIVSLIPTTGIALFFAYSTGWVLDHYWVPVLPFFLLYAGYIAMTIYRTIPWPKARPVFLAILVVALVWSNMRLVRNYLLIANEKGRDYRHEAPGVDANQLATYITANTSPQDSIWVYYNMPEVYWLADRRPATREPVGNYLASFYNSAWFDRTYNELESSRPALIVGITATRWPEEGVSEVQELPRVKELLAQRYDCIRDAVPNTVICKRTEWSGNPIDKNSKMETSAHPLLMRLSIGFCTVLSRTSEASVLPGLRAKAASRGHRAACGTSASGEVREGARAWKLSRPDGREQR